MCLFRLSWSASLAEFEHVQLPAEYAWFGRGSRNFLNAFEIIADCRFPIANSLPSVKNEQLAIGNWQSAMAVCYRCRAVKNPKEKLIGSRRSDPRARNHYRQTAQRLL